MAQIEWNETKLSVGVLMFDTEHKRLISIINKLDEAMRQGKGNAVIAQVLKELINYTKTHFTHEERVMKQHNYPGLEVQLKEHKGFVDKIVGMERDLASGKAMLSLSVSNFVSAWIQNHIMKTDKASTKFLNAKGGK
ncbi:MAG: bacteriohemerythrin [Deferribacteraceae bacterium]|jgi:hemerythrin-like metal-binding protein|nr:bacteriohemerythrin [Deferribacteraceae bacterium]